MNYDLKKKKKSFNNAFFLNFSIDSEISNETVYRGIRSPVR